MAIMSPRSLITSTPLFLFLVLSSVVVPAALAIRPNDDDVTASRRREVLDGIRYLLREGPVLSSECARAVAEAPNKDADTLSCLGSVGGNLMFYLSSLSQLAPEKGAAEFAVARDRIAELLAATAGVNDTVSACPERTIDAVPALGRMVVYENKMRDTVNLMYELAPPPEHGDPARDACEAAAKTANVDACVGVLRVAPGAREAAAKNDPRRLAELVFRYVYGREQELAAEARRDAAAAVEERRPTLAACLREFDGVMTQYVSGMAALAPEKGDAEFAEAGQKLAALTAAGMEKSVGSSCSSEDWGAKPITHKVSTYRYLVDVAADLINAAAAPKAQGY